MHIAEGMLPATHAAAWSVASGTILLASYASLKKKLDLNDEKTRLKLAAAGAFAFLLSALKLPSLTGSCSHPTGLGLATLLYGPQAATILGLLVLLFQALLLAHGGLTTLGANLFSMGIFGPWIVTICMAGLVRCRLPLWFCVGCSAALGDLFTYVATSAQLGAAFPDASGGIVVSTGRFLAIFAITQVPLAVTDGWVTWLLYRRLKEDSSFEESS